MNWPWSKQGDDNETPKSPLPVPDTPTFNLGDIVRKKYGKDYSGMIVGILYRFGGTVSFCVNWADQQGEQLHFAEELALDEGFKK